MNKKQLTTAILEHDNLYFEDYPEVLNPDKGDTKTTQADIEKYMVTELLENYFIEDTNADNVEMKNDWQDNAHEWADGQVDIYNQDLFEKAWDFKEATEDAIEEYGDLNEEVDLIKIFMRGQYYAYSRYAHHIGNLVEEILNETD